MKGFPISFAFPRQAMSAAVVGLALSLTIVPASAEPHGGRGMGGGGGGVDQMLGRVLQHAKANLNLNSSQQVMWDNAVAQSRAARETSKANRQQVKATLKTELARPEPDLAAVAAAADAIEQQNRALRLGVRNEWLRLYASLSPEQKAIAREMMQKRLERAESFGAKMREHMQAHPRAN